MLAGDHRLEPPAELAGELSDLEMLELAEQQNVVNPSSSGRYRVVRRFGGTARFLYWRALCA